MQQQHLISVLMENEAGSLSRLVGLFSQRGYNIETLNVAPTDDPSISRLTVTTITSPERIEQITKQLHKLIEEKQPRTMDSLIDLVHESGLVNQYGTGFHIVQYMGAIQGVKVSITGRKLNHYLPSTGSYGVFDGLEKYIDAGMKIEYIGDLQGSKKI